MREKNSFVTRDVLGDPRPVLNSGNTLSLYIAVCTLGLRYRVVFRQYIVLVYPLTLQVR